MLRIRGCGKRSRGQCERTRWTGGTGRTGASDYTSRVRNAFVPSVIPLLLVLVACETGPEASTPLGPPPASVAIDAPAYRDAFRAAHDVLRDAGFTPDLEDRDGGIIETRPRNGGSLLEPWAWADGDAGNAVADTLAWQRRKVRVEFVPIAFRSAATPEPAAPELPGMGAPRDLSRHDGPIEARVWVFVERAFTPYLRRSNWTRQATTFATNPERPGRSVTGGAPGRWTPIGRDPVMEAAVRDRLGGRLAALPATASPEPPPAVEPTVPRGG